VPERYRAVNVPVLLHGDNLLHLRELVRTGVDLRSYVDALMARLELVYTLLAPHGSMVVHLDPRTVHYVKVACDERFGRDRFAGEIIWRYRRWPTPSRNLQSMHDVLLRYVRDPTALPRFHQAYEPLAASTKKTWGDNRQLALFREGDGARRRTRSSTTEERSPGAPLSDVWDVGIIAPVSKERTSFPTQKPLALLRRLVEIFSDEGDLVLDPYCGSGTTLDASRQLGRRSIGIDRSDLAIRISSVRLGIERLAEAL
jgi:site-specific DNA-methyltransferase (adenine-specific)